MGDRGNLRILFENGKEIYFYTHWDGSELPLTLQNALKRNLRWDDESYLSRIIFCEMIKGIEQSETGFGIAPYICDNEHVILTVNLEKQQIEWSDKSAGTLGNEFTLSFKNYCNIDFGSKAENYFDILFDNAHKEA